MTAEIGSLFVGLIADTSKYASGMNRAESITNATMSRVERRVTGAARSTGRLADTLAKPINPVGFIFAEKSLGRLDARARSLPVSLRGATSAVAALAGAFGASTFVRTLNSFTSIENQLKSLDGGLGNTNAQFRALLDVSNRSRSGLDGTATVFSRIAKALPELGLDKTLRSVETIQKALQLGGATTQEATSAAIQFSQALASGRLQGDELRAILETPLGGALAKGLGITIGQLRALSTEGKLTSQILIGALDKIAPEIDASFANSTRTVAQALTIAKNEFVAYVGEVDKAYGITRLLGDGIEATANNLDGIGRIAKYAGLTLASVFSGRLFDRGFSGIRTGLRDIKTEAVASVGAAKAEVDELTDALRRAATDKFALRGLSPGAARASFADPQTLKALARESERLKRLDGDKLELIEKINAETVKLGTITANTSTKAVAATEKIAASEVKLNDLLATQKRLRGIVAAGPGPRTEFGRMAFGAGDTRAIDEANRRVEDARRRLIKIDRDAAAEAARLSALRVGLATRETEATQRAANARIAALGNVNRLSRELTAIEQQREAATVKVRRLVDERDVTAAKGLGTALGNTTRQVTALSGALPIARAQLVAKTAAARGLGLALTTSLAAGRSLVGFLGGPWGVAFALATGAMILLGARSAQSAQAVADAEEVVRRRLGKMAESSDAARKSFDQLKLEDAISVTESDIEKTAKGIDDLTDGVLALAAAIDVTRQQTGVFDDFPNAPLAVNVFKELIANLKNGKISTEEATAAARAFANQPFVDQAQIQEIEKLIAKTKNLSAATRDAAAERAKLRDFGIPDRSNPLGDIENSFRGSQAILAKGSAALDSATVAQILEQQTQATRKIADDLITKIGTGIEITPAIQALVDERGKNLGLLNTLEGIITKSASVDQNTANIVNSAVAVGASRSRNLGGELGNLVTLNAKITEVKKNIQDTRAFIQNLPTLSPAIFGDGADLAKANLLITQTKANVAALAAGWQNNKLSASKLYSEIEKIRTSLHSVAGKNNIVDDFIASIYTALQALPLLKNELNQLKNISSGAFTTKTGSALGSNGRPIDVKITGGVIEKSLYEMAREARLAREAVEAAADEAAAYEEEASGQRDDILSEQRNTTRGIGFLGSQMGGMRQDFLVSFGRTFGGTESQNSANAQRKIDMLSVEQSVLQTNLQYKNLTPEERTAAEYRLAEIAIAIAKLGYQIQVYQYDVNSGFSKTSTSYTPMPGSTPSPKGFATGGAFKVGGYGGVDSQMVEFMASPNEIVGVYTPEQWEAMMEGGDTEVTNVQNSTVNQYIQTPALNEFRHARRQIENDARRGMPG